MHGGAIIVIILLRALYQWGKQSDTGGAGKGFQQEVSLRFVFLAVLFVVVYLGLVFTLAENLPRLTGFIRSDGLRDTFEVAVAWLAPLALLRKGPRWLAWRVCRPLRLQLPARIIYGFIPGAGQQERECFAMLLRATRGEEIRAEKVVSGGLKGWLVRFFLLQETPLPLAFDARTVATEALALEVRGDCRRADLFLRAFELRPPERRSSAPLARFALEELARHAALREDWQAVLRRAGYGRGRGLRLLRLLARQNLDGGVHPALLWTVWLLAPFRRETLPLVRSALAGRPAPAAEPAAPAYAAPHEDPRLAQIRLLQRVSRGETVTMDDVFRLAVRWEGAFAPLEKERLLRRGMELGARDVLGASEAVEEMVLEELEEMVATADGEIPEAVVAEMEDGGLSCGCRLAMRLRNRMFDEVERCQERFQVEQGQQFDDGEVLEFWEAWLAMQAAAARLHRVLGSGELANLWYGGLREAAWNNASRLFNSCGVTRTGWIAVIMFHWVAETSRLLEDEEGETANRNNTKICGYTPPWSIRTALRRLAAPFLRIGERLRGLWEKIQTISVFGLWLRLAQFGQRRATLIIPLGGMMLVLAVIGTFWSGETAMACLFVGFPVLVAIYTLFYLVAGRLTKRGADK